MVNCNPETVSTDYDTSDRLYFEPLTFEDVLNIVERERPLGVIVQFGGQTPLKLAVPLREAGVPILGTSPDAIDRAEDRQRFNALIGELGLRQARRRHRPLAATRPPDHRRHHRLPGAGPPLLRAGRPGHADRLRRGGPRALHDRGGARRARASHPRRQVPRGRDRDRRGRRLPTASAWWSAGSWSTSRRRACTRATPPARCRPTRSATTRSSGSCAQTRGAGPGAGRDRADQRAVRDPERAGLRPRGEPARLAHRARSCPRPSACRWPSSPPR